MLETQINEAFLAAYKAKNELEVNTLRMIKSAILNKKIEKKLAKEDVLADEDVLSVLKSEVKKRNDSAISYREGQREDLAKQEDAEISIIAKFLPEQLSEDQVRAAIAEVIGELGNPGPAGFGKLMGAVIARTKGAADGAVVSKLLKEELAK